MTVIGRGARRAVAVVLMVGAAATATGCLDLRVPGRDGAVHHVIIGFGVVTENRSHETALLATSVQAVGVNISDRPGLKLGIGYSAATVVSVPDGAEDVRAEISRAPFGPLKIDVQRAVLGPAASHDTQREDE